ncbi:WD-40 repeat protein [Reticulomyxa filosa]|uniref:WD-40 repeat protein n=1 Tax=Reticulomyxa filosa TaxID=46433 RepID=X6ME75_RETFI|nr:WD-40 repeat protein [Reticulomyxa filosa]|eukprot:ETO11946.1 WD-40 repeat protein [Reticulomyxa filosa]
MLTFDIKIYNTAKVKKIDIISKRKTIEVEKMGTSLSKKGLTTRPAVSFISTCSSEKKNLPEEEIELIIRYWVRILSIKLGWIHDFDRLIAEYVEFIFVYSMISIYLLLFHKNCFRRQILLNVFTEHMNLVYSIDVSTFGDSQNYFFWDFKNNQQLQVFDGHNGWIGGIEFSPFNGGRYLCSGSGDDTIRLWDVETSKSLHAFNKHKSGVWCVAISPLQSNNNNNNKKNNIGIIGGNGYTICSGSWDKTIRIWDIETTKQMVVFKGHEMIVMSVKYGSNELGINGGSNIILSGSEDKSVRLWDTRSGQQIQVFDGHTNDVWAVEYSPFVVNNIEVGGCSNVICSGSRDCTIRFWDIRSNKSEAHVIKAHNEIMCLKFFQLKENTKNKNDRRCDVKLCYGSYNGPICIWG